MLIFTRHVGQRVVIGDDVTICVLGVKGDQVRVGIQARKEIPVHRGEIYARIKQQTQSARVAPTHGLTARSAQPQI